MVHSADRARDAKIGRELSREFSGAAGRVIAQLGVGPEDALALLRAHAFADGASMAVIAKAVVERRLDFSIEDDSRAVSS